MSKSKRTNGSSEPAVKWTRVGRGTPPRVKAICRLADALAWMSTDQINVLADELRDVIPAAVGEAVAKARKAGAAC